MKKINIIISLVIGIGLLAAPLFINTPPASAQTCQEGREAGKQLKTCEKEVKCSNPKECIQKNGIVELLNKIITLISVLAGVAISIALIVGGIQYSTAGGNPSAIGAAKKRIFGAILALLAFIFLRAFLIFIVPGGSV